MTNSHYHDETFTGESSPDVTDANEAFINRLDQAREAAIKEQVDILMNELDPSVDKLLPMEARRAKIEQEVRNSLNFPDLEDHFVTAFIIIRTEGKNYLSEEEYDNLMNDFNELRRKLNTFDPSQLTDESYDELLSISDEGISAILKIAIAKFEENQLPESLSIFTILSTLEADEPDFTYRLGLVAQNCERYEVAIHAFNDTIKLEPHHIGAHVFAAQCYHSENKQTEALKELEEVKEILKTNHDEEWIKLVEDLEVLLA